MSMQSPQQIPSSENGLIIELIEQALHSLHAASDAAALLAAHLSPILPDGAPDEITGLLATGNHHQDSHENASALECLVRSLSLRADALTNALAATHEAVRL